MPVTRHVAGLLLHDRRDARNRIKVLADQLFIKELQSVVFLDVRDKLEDAGRVEDAASEKRLLRADDLLLVKEDLRFDIGRDFDFDVG